jgi:hypothetical protein
LTGSEFLALYVDGRAFALCGVDRGAVKDSAIVEIGRLNLVAAKSP